MTAPHNPLEGESSVLSFKLQGQGFEELVSIIIVHRDRPEYLNICLQTVTLASRHNNFELIVVDNGSGQRSQEFLDQLETDGVKVIRNNENLWWSKAANQGAKASHKDSKYLIFMHHDIMVLNPAWIDLLINVSVFRKSGLVGTQFRNYDVNDQRVTFISEDCMLVTRECWNDVGPFAEELPQEGAPFLFTAIAEKAGYNPLTIDQKTIPCVHHWGLAAFDYNEYERLSEDAKAKLPKLLNEIQNRFT